MSKYEYLENNPDTWVFHEPPPFPHWFQEELIRIGGKNRHGAPNLRLVWGGTEKQDRTEDTTLLKYHCGYSQTKVLGYKYCENDEWKFIENIDDLDKSIMIYPVTAQDELGLMRWVVEKWVSPEELEMQKRFETRNAPDDKEFILREFPREGIYDCYQIIADSEERFRDVDWDLVHYFKQRWHYEQNTSWEQHEKNLAEIKQREHQKGLAWNEELKKAAINLDLKLDPEERERREEYWAKQHDYSQDRF